MLAYLNSTPVRVVIVTGPVREREAEDERAKHDRATGRQLDEQSWFVESFEEATGAFLLVRGSAAPLSIIAKEGGTDEIPMRLQVEGMEEASVVDQFIIDERPATYTLNGVRRYRNPCVRHRVLERSGGICELTGIPGFSTSNGGVYLETHHIVPLSEGGLDTVENVIALTADAHRRAHFGAGWLELRVRCLEIVAARIRMLEMVNERR